MIPHALERLAGATAPSASAAPGAPSNRATRRVRRPRLSFAVGLAVLVAGTSITPVGATSPGRDGRLTFMRYGPDQWQVWVSKADLADAVPITDGPSDSGFPVWSPDGRRIAFDSGRSDPDPADEVFVNDVYTMRPDGTDVRKVTDSHGFSGEPAWSPDGRMIAFSSDRGATPARQAIYVIRPDGTAMRRVTKLPPVGSWQGSPRFSPDGRRLAFTEFRPAPDAGGVETSALFTINLDGTRLRRITPWSTHPGDADWSPDGRRIVFETILEWPDRAASVWIVDADGSDLRQLTVDRIDVSDPATFTFEGSFDPVWAPDGRTILFSRDEYLPGAEGSTGLQVMDADGSHRRWVSTVHGAEHQADWESVNRHN